MKNLFFIGIFLLLSACSTNLHDLIFGEYIPKEIINPECNITPDGIYTVQVLDNGVLARTVKYFRRNGDIDKNYFQKPDYDQPMIYISVDKDNLKNKYDEAYFGFDENSCLKSDGTYSYSTAIGSKKTVQKFKIIQPRYIENPKYKSEQNPNTTGTQPEQL